ncbi:hypothetical protein RQP46_006181 [Phenoliferia psychrophenolica]
MDEFEDALASAALDSQDVAAREPGASGPPVLPPELVANIIDLAVEILVEKERNLPSQTLLANEFLCSAALVDRTWNAIATAALLKNGLVRPGLDQVFDFIMQTRSHGIRETLDRVRFGAGTKGLIIDDSDPPDEGADEMPFELLVMMLPNLKYLESVGRGLRFNAALTRPHNIQHLIISNVTYLDVPLRAQKLALMPPMRLSVFETQLCPLDPEDMEMYLPFVTFLGQVHDINIYTTQNQPDFYFSFMVLLNIVGKLPALRELKVPACWRSNAVEGACEAKGVDVQ